VLILGVLDPTPKGSPDDILKPKSTRLDYLDWMRGLAAIIMLQGHAFDSWLAPQYRSGELFWLSQFLGGFPAPIFLFLVGASLALVLDRMRRKGASTTAMLARVMKRGAWILLIAYAYRLEQYWIWRPASRWNDVLRVDTLNCIAAASLIVGVLSLAFKTRKQNAVGMSLLAAAVVIVTPWIHPLRFPGIIGDYLNGSGHSYYFSLFPWISFTLVGIAFGYGVLEARARNLEDRFFSWVVGTGILACAIGMTLPFFKVFEYGFFDYSLTSPHYFLVRLGWLSIVLYGVYKWCNRSNTPEWSPVRVFGQASLLVYWAHMELVYGKPFHAFERVLDVAEVFRQLLWLIPCMLLLAAARQYGFLRLIRTGGNYGIELLSAAAGLLRQPSAELD
jgi:uncharacterized membrane protein